MTHNRVHAHIQCNCIHCNGPTNNLGYKTAGEVNIGKCNYIAESHTKVVIFKITVPPNHILEFQFNKW